MQWHGSCTYCRERTSASPAHSFTRVSFPRESEVAEMARKFFDQTLLDSGTRDKKTRRRALTLPVSIAIHAVVLIALVVVPMLSFGDLPEPSGNNTVKAFFVEQAPPPPPPPPPPPAPAPAPPKP